MYFARIQANYHYHLKHTMIMMSGHCISEQMGITDVFGELAPFTICFYSHCPPTLITQKNYNPRYTNYLPHQKVHKTTLHLRTFVKLAHLLAISFMLIDPCPQSRPNIIDRANFAHNNINAL
jgi:hypothetical protein